jgi:NADPH2:quinone reductase
MDGIMAHWLLALAVRNPRTDRVCSVKAIQIVNLSGPDGALRLMDLPEPEASHPMTPGRGVVIDVHAAGVAFPELLQTRGEYQSQPALPFVPGSEVGGVVRRAPAGAPVRPGDRVAAFCALGAWAETVVAPLHLVFPLPDELDFAQGAALTMNYHTAYFSLVTRGQLHEGETVLVHGAAGGVGTATLQVARALGARTVAIVSSDEKEDVARQAGADEVLRSDGPWKDQARAWSSRGVDIVIDPVGGDRFTDSLRALGEGGRLVVVGFAGGSIPEVKVNRLLLNNLSVVGAGWGAFAMSKPDVVRAEGQSIAAMVAGGFVRPIIGQRFPLARAAEALELLDQRGALGKVVLDVQPQHAG